MRKLGFGCLGVIALFVLAALYLVVEVATNKPAEPDFGTIETREGLSNPETVFTAGTDEGNVKPVRLSLDVEMARLDLKSGGNDGKIDVSGNFDKANFDLTTEIVEKDDYIDYRIKFKSKRSFLGLIMSSNNGGGIDNRVEIVLPKNLLYDLKLKVDKGEFNIDATGLALANLDIESSMGELWLGMSEPNPVKMENMKVSSSMGATYIGDLQNLGPTKADFSGSMGELTVSNSGDLRNDMDIKFNMTMGEARLEVPENVALDTSTSAFLGESRQPRRAKSETPTAKMRVRGGVTMGEHNVVYRSSNRTSNRQARFQRDIIMRKFIDAENITAAIDAYRQVRDDDPVANYLSEGDLNRLGYNLLGRQRLEDAVKIFQLNVELHPDYANGYDSLGEGYKYIGEFDLAIESYEKSLELDPDNRNGKRMLEKIKEEQRASKLL